MMALGRTVGYSGILIVVKEGRITLNNLIKQDNKATLLLLWTQVSVCVFVQLCCVQI